MALICPCHLHMTCSVCWTSLCVSCFSWAWLTVPVYGVVPPYVTLAVHLEPHTSRMLSIFLFTREVDVVVAKYDVINQLSLYVIGNIAKPGELLHRCRISTSVTANPSLSSNWNSKEFRNYQLDGIREPVTPILKMSHFRNKSWSLDDEVNWGEKRWLCSVEHCSTHMVAFRVIAHNSKSRRKPLSPILKCLPP